MMKNNVQVKDEPVEFQIDKLLRLYNYQSSSSSSSSSITKTSRMKSTGNDGPEASTCAWCQKLGGRSFTLHTENGDSKSLCSEVCFNQYRRASFKKNKGSDNEMEQTSLTMKIKSPEKRKREQISNECNRRKIFLPHRHLTSSNTKTKANELSRTCSPSSSSSSSSKPPHSSPQPSALSNGKLLHINSSPNLPLNLTWLPSTLPWSTPLDLNRFSYPFLPPPPPPPPVTPPAVPSVTSSNLFTTLSKSTSSNFTCILPTFIPLPIPIPIPICLPLSSPCTKCSIEVNDKHTQTNLNDFLSSPLLKRIRRLSI